MLRKPPCAEAHLSSPPGASPTSLLLGGGGREVPGAGSKSSRGLDLGVPVWGWGCFCTALGKAWGGLQSSLSAWGGRTQWLGVGGDDVGRHEKLLPGHRGSALEGQVLGEKLRLLSVLPRNPSCSQVSAVRERDSVVVCGWARMCV